MAAVEHLLLISSGASLGRKISVEEHELRYPKCKNKKYVREQMLPRAGKIPRPYIADGLGAIPYRL